MLSDPFLNFITALAIFVPATVLFIGFFLAFKRGSVPVYITAPVALATVIFGTFWIRTYWGGETQLQNDIALVGAIVIWSAGLVIGVLTAKGVPRQS